MDSCCGFPRLRGRPLLPTGVHAKREVGYQKLHTQKQSRGVYNPKENHLNTFDGHSAHPEQSFLGPDLVF